MSALIADAAKQASDWITSHTEIDPNRAGAAVLGFMLWVECKDITVSTLEIHSSSKPHWNRNKMRTRKPRRKGQSYMRPATISELQSYCIGRSQRRGTSPMFWYAVPAEKLTEPVPKTVGEWLGTEPSKEIVK